MFGLLFGSLVLILGLVKAVEYRKAHSGEGEKSAFSADFSAFQFKYLTVYLVVMFSDWLQGPYVYNLYDSYGYSETSISLLFVAGFLSSMVMGTFVGAVADKYGRRLLALVFGLVYAASCVTKLSTSFGVLMLGRVLSGVATSLLYSVFEAWMISEHERLAFPQAWMSDTFARASFGNGIAAISAGLVAQAVADEWGPVAPFMLALVVLLGVTAVIYSSWSENFGDSTVDVKDIFVNGMAAIRNDRKILLLGCIQSFFEGAMFAFVFVWSPALKAITLEIPYGLVFACYMVAIMLGSSIFSLLLGLGLSVQLVGRAIYPVAAVSLLLASATSDLTITLVSFCIFEITCGLYFPTQGTLRGTFVPESSRSAVMNLFRIPLNAIVCVLLLKSEAMGPKLVLFWCGVSLAAAGVCQYYLALLIAAAPARHERVATDDPEDGEDLPDVVQ